MFITDTMLTIPGVPLIIVISAVITPRESWAIGLILAIDNWPGLTRAVRSQILPLRDQEYVEASRIMGISTSGIVLVDIVPNLMPYVLINFAGAARGIIFESVGLYFLGILPTTQPNWGVQINTAFSTSGALYSLEFAHWFVVPMIAILLMSLGFVMFAQAADRLFNPRIIARHERTSADAEAVTDE
jgi:peptide/nickel transport system permease protein